MSGKGERRSPWLRFARLASRVALVLAGLAMGVVLALLLFPERRPDLFEEVERGWRAAYHPDLLFLGKPTVRTDREILYDWRGDPPDVGGLGRNRFSVRWDTCLTLPQPATVELRVGADDGVRAFIDGEEVVDDWNEHAFRRRTGAGDLEAGPHHVVVEYYEKAGTARVEAMLLLMTDPEQEVPLSWLRPPTHAHDHPSPCRGDDRGSD